MTGTGSVAVRILFSLAMKWVANHQLTVNRWRQFVVASIMLSPVTKMLETLVYFLCPIWYETWLEHDALVCWVLTPCRKWLNCLHMLVDTFETAIFDLLWMKVGIVLAKRADEDAAQSLNAFSEMELLRTNLSVSLYSVNISFTSDDGSWTNGDFQISWMNPWWRKNVSSIWHDRPARYDNEKLDQGQRQS